MRHRQSSRPTASRLHRVHVWITLTALILLCLPGATARAQFSGPAFNNAAPVNVPATLTTDPAILYPPGRDVRLMHGDLLTIHVYGTTDYAPVVRVELDGSIQLPLIGVVHVEGLTIIETERLIAKRLRDAGMYRDPQVTIALTESPNQVVTLSGEMHGVVPVVGTKRLYDVISAAGGLPPLASHVVTINRPGIAQPIVVDLGNNPSESARADVPIFPGDTIIISRVGVVYLLGAFKNSVAIPLREYTPLTLMQAAALGGGMGYEAKLGDLKLIRTEGVERKVVQIDFKKVMDGKAPDPVLQPDDIVLLPTSAMKAAIKSGGVSTLLGLASVLIFAAKQ
ncbi:polysaccharide biosynthesis/export family protein [Edaphobacter sp.]|uniref:polysaccharide biosynthesis/export family protein n=1 Tax=Edaphobacter sp. TaxID=1934404 RepID=UPI002DB72A8B|nr:polysaccharide biosynthesis/export family protein [Edaphobacter sp.]HEU5339971.1 polysaccharide biosynthesis/export family protein [Edaphobacter sp.]